MTIDLTPKQEQFCLKYIELGNASEAYRQSYDAENMKPETVNREAFALLENPKITTRINELKDGHLKRHEVTIDRVLAEYAKLAFLDIRKAFDEEGNLKPIHELDDDTAAAIAGLEVDKRVSSFVGEDGKPVAESHLHKIKLSDKKGALDSLARHLGMFTDKTEISGPGGTPIKTDTTLTITPEAVRAIIQQVRDEY
jgi:phage terminase small subunit